MQIKSFFAFDFYYRTSAICFRSLTTRRVVIKRKKKQIKVPTLFYFFFSYHTPIGGVIPPSKRVVTPQSGVHPAGVSGAGNPKGDRATTKK